MIYLLYILLEQKGQVEHQLSGIWKGWDMVYSGAEFSKVP